jgi:O-antigen/teichoic acid export membrane protein
MQPPSRSLRLSFLWALAGNAITAAAQWAVIILLARWATSTDVGRYAIALAITSPLLNLANLHLRAVHATDTGSDFRFGHFAALRILTTGGFLLAIAGVLFLSPMGSPTSLVLIAVALSRLSESGSDLLYGQLHQQERLDRISQSQILRSVATVAALAFGMASGGSPLRAIVYSGLAGWATLFLFDIPVALSTCGTSLLRPLWQPALLRRLFWLALPLGFTQILNSVHANLPRYLLEHWHGARAVGLFSAQAYVILAANLFVVALGQAVAPRAARAFQQDLPLFYTLAQRLILLAAFLGVAGMFGAALFGPAALSRIYGAEYGANPQAIHFLMLAGGLSYLSSALGCCLTSARQFLPQVQIVLLATVVTTAAGILLVPNHAIEGAALAHACGYAIQCAASVWFLKRAIRDGRQRQPPPPTVQSSLHAACLES